jgi:hypothetical protein
MAIPRQAAGEKSVPVDVTGGYARGTRALTVRILCTARRAAEPVNLLAAIFHETRLAFHK